MVSACTQIYEVEAIERNWSGGRFSVRLRARPSEHKDPGLLTITVDEQQARQIQIGDRVVVDIAPVLTPPPA
jgi:hypothetical protein